MKKKINRKSTRQAWKGWVTELGVERLYIVSDDSMEVASVLNEYHGRNPVETVRMEFDDHTTRWKPEKI